MKHTLAILMLLCPFSALSVLLDRTVAIVGDNVILKSDVDKYMSQDANAPKSFEKALADLVEKQIVESECKKLALYPSESDLKQAINDVKRQNKLDDKSLELALAKMGFTFAAYQSQLSFEMCRSRLVQTKIRNRVNITKDDIQRAYDQQYGDHKSFRLELRDMDFSVKAKKAAQDALNALRAGKDWKEVLKDAKKGGHKVHERNLGVVSKSDLVPEIGNVIFSHTDEKFKGPVPAGDGIHVFEILGKVDGPQIPLADVEKDLHKLLFEKELERLLRQYIEEAKASTYVDIQDLERT